MFYSNYPLLWRMVVRVSMCRLVHGSGQWCSSMTCWPPKKCLLNVSDYNKEYRQFYLHFFRLFFFGMKDFPFVEQKIWDLYILQDDKEYNNCKTIHFLTNRNKMLDFIVNYIWFRCLKLILYSILLNTKRKSQFNHYTEECM